MGHKAEKGSESKLSPWAWLPNRLAVAGGLGFIAGAAVGIMANQYHQARQERVEEKRWRAASRENRDMTSPEGLGQFLIAADTRTEKNGTNSPIPKQVVRLGEIEGGAAGKSVVISAQAAGLRAHATRKRGVPAIGFLHAVGKGTEARKMWTVQPEHPDDRFQEKTIKDPAQRDGKMLQVIANPSQDVTEIAFGVVTVTRDEKQEQLVIFEPYDTSLIAADGLKQLETGFPMAPIYQPPSLTGTAG